MFEKNKHFHLCHNYMYWCCSPLIKIVFGMLSCKYSTHKLHKELVVFRLKMRALIILFLACLLGHKAHAWGGLFNRFSPEMLANMGYGGHGGFIQVSIHLNLTRRSSTLLLNFLLPNLINFIKIESGQCWSNFKIKHSILSFT